MGITTRILLHTKADKIISIVKEMRERGFRQGVDFDFNHIPPVFDYKHGVIPRKTIFTFYDEELVTIFAIIWSEYSA